MAEAHALSHSEEHHHPNYMAVFWILLVVTIAEVVVTFIPFFIHNPALMVITLLLMAFGKAILVALYFMHLKYDNIILTVIAAVPMILVSFAVAVVAYELTHYTPASELKAPPRALNLHHE